MIHQKLASMTKVCCFEFFNKIYFHFHLPLLTGCQYPIWICLTGFLCTWPKFWDNVKVLVVLNWKSLKIFGPTVFAADRFDFQNVDLFSLNWHNFWRMGFFRSLDWVLYFSAATINIGREYSSPAIIDKNPNEWFSEHQIFERLCTLHWWFMFNSSETWQLKCLIDRLTCPC